MALKAKDFKEEKRNLEKTSQSGKDLKEEKKVPEKTDPGKSDIRELNKLCDRCQQLTDDNQKLNTRILELEEELKKSEITKQRYTLDEKLVVEEDSTGLKTLQDQYDKLFKDYEAIQLKLKEKEVEYNE